MRAIVYLGDGQFEIRDVPTPSPGPGEVLVRVEANTICGTDLRIVSGAKRSGVFPPVILGHEAAGTVVEVGEGFDRLAVGDRVGVTPSVPCSWCWACLRGHFHLCLNVKVLGHAVDGGLAEYFLAPAQGVSSGMLVKAPQELDAAEIALAEPLSCVLHGQRILSTTIGDVVVVLGGGPIGQLHAQLARVNGARTVIMSEPVESRRNLGLSLGVDVAIDPAVDDLRAAVDEATDGMGADVVVVCVGVPELVSTAVSIARQRARISLFAGFPPGSTSPVDANAIHYREIVLTGSSNSTAVDYGAALDLIASRRVDVRPLISHRFSLDSFAEGVRTAGDPEAMKVAITP